MARDASAAAAEGRTDEPDLERENVTVMKKGVVLGTWNMEHKLYISYKVTTHEIDEWMKNG